MSWRQPARASNPRASTVIVSGARVAGGGANVAGNCSGFADETARREFPAMPVLVYARARSFDSATPSLREGVAPLRMTECRTNLPTRLTGHLRDGAGAQGFQKLAGFQGI